MILDFEAFKKALLPFENIAITAPAGADGDSVGTQCSLRELLLQIYPKKRIRIVNEEPCPFRYEILPGSKFFEVSADILKGSQSDWPDCMICVDGGSTRLGDETTRLWKAAKSRGQVDHHAIGGPLDYDFRLYDPKAAATTEIVFKFGKALNLSFTPTVAQALYVGLVFDTGLFKHNNTTPETLLIASDLLKAGFDHTSTIEGAMLMRTKGAFALLQVALAGAKFEDNGRFVWTAIDQQGFKSTGADADDREGIIDNLFLVRGCEIACFLFEKVPNEWKVSFRSRGWDVASLARSLNPQGGGHKLAAGCTLKGSKAEVSALCKDAALSLLKTKG